MIETEVKNEWTDRCALDGAHSGVVSQSVTPFICVFSYHQDLRRFKTGILSTKPAYLWAQLAVFTLPFHSTEIRVSRSNWDSYSCSLLWAVAIPLGVAMSVTLSLGNANLLCDCMCLLSKINTQEVSLLLEMNQGWVLLCLYNNSSSLYFWSDTSETTVQPVWCIMSYLKDDQKMKLKSFEAALSFGHLETWHLVDIALTCLSPYEIVMANVRVTRGMYLGANLWDSVWRRRSFEESQTFWPGT